MKRDTTLRLWLLVGLLISVTLALQQLARHGYLYSGIEQGQSLPPHLQVYRDPSARMGIEAIASDFEEGHFYAPTAEELVFGYTRDAIWVTVEFSNQGPEPVTRYLEVGPPRLADLRLFEAGTDGRFHEQRAGLQVPVRERLVKTRQSVFPVVVAPGEQRRLFLRIQSNNALLVDLKLWDPADFMEASRKFDLVNGMQFGALLMFALYAFVASAAMRDRTHLFFGITLLSHGLYDITILQYGYQYLWPESPDWSLRGAGVVLAIGTFGLGMLVSGVLDARQRMPGWHFALGGLSLLALAYVPGMLYGDYPSWVQWLNYVALLQLVVTISATLQAVFRGYRGATLLLGAFLILWFTSLLRVGQILGYLPSDVLAEYSHGWAMVLGGLFMALIQADRVRRLNGEREEARRTLLQAQVAAREEAEHAVIERTQELKQAKEAAEASNRAKSAFLAQISHELRTPLHSILGYSNLMRGEAGDAESQRRLDAIRRSGLHLLQLIDGLLDYARGEAGRLQLELQPLRLRDFLESVVEETRELARSDQLVLTTEFAPGLPMALRLDGSRLRQLLINLIGNACRHSQGRRIVLEARPEPGVHEGRPRFSLAVRDDGIGIAATERERLFQPFEQGPQAGSKGLGLGLAISRQLAALMGGELVLESSVQGCCFRLFLDAEAVDLPDCASHVLLPPRGRRYAGPPRRLLVVDDEAESREVLSQLLLVMGFSVVAAESGEIALARLAEDGIHAVLTDQRMPAMDGMQLLRAARRQGFTQPFLLVSAAPGAESADRAGEEAGFDAILAKPLTPEALAAAIGRVLGLAWRQEAVAPTMTVTAAPSRPLLDALGAAAREGRISDIEDWIELVLAQQPEAADFALAVRAAARRLDLASIEAMTR